MRIFGKETSEQVPMTLGRMLGLVGTNFVLGGVLLDKIYENPILSLVGFALVVLGVVLSVIGLFSAFEAKKKRAAKQTPSTGTKT